MNPSDRPGGAAGESSAAEWIERLGLRRHPEGGWYRELFRAERDVTTARGERRSGLTSIYFLLEAGQFGRWHQVSSDEVWHFLAGDPMEVPAYDPASGRIETGVVGPLPDHSPFFAARADWWQASRALGRFALVGCSVGPGFDFADFRFVSDIAGHAALFEGPTGLLSAYRDLL
jgi:predicted cupin superfamily sugar epimerase